MQYLDKSQKNMEEEQKSMWNLTESINLSDKVNKKFIYR